MRATTDPRLSGEGGDDVRWCLDELDEDTLPADGRLVARSRMDEADVVAGGAASDASLGEAHAAGSEPLDGRVKIVDPQSDVIERGLVHARPRRLVDRLHEIDLDAVRALADREDVLADVLARALVRALDGEPEHVDPEHAQARPVARADRDLLHAEDPKRPLFAARHARMVARRGDLGNPRSAMSETKKTSLTGVKPTSTPHLGNYLGAIRPALALAKERKTLYFIADYHALTTMRDPAALRAHTLDVTAAWLACGLDPKETILFRQSDVIEVFELAWVFACLCAVGQLERSHAYKDAIEQGAQPNAGVFTYPLLMAADIVLYDTDVVPIGNDQKQHLEIARDVATRLNHHFGEGTVVVPEALITDAPLVPGLDGRKMSKSYGNAIPLFAPADELEKLVMSIKTGSTPLEAPKEPEGSTVYELFRLVASASDSEEMAKKLRAGGYGWGHAKKDLVGALEAELGPKRQRYDNLRGEPVVLDELLEAGAERAREIAQRTMRRVRAATGIGRTARSEKSTVKIK